MLLLRPAMTRMREKGVNVSGVVVVGSRSGAAGDYFFRVRMYATNDQMSLALGIFFSKAGISL